jgi:hypothetical protein
VTATVIDLTSRLKPSTPACGCTKHILDDLVARAHRNLRGYDDVSLIPREVLELAIADMTSTIGRALAASQARSKP